MIDLVLTHLNQPWGPPWTLATIDDHWRHAWKWSFWLQSFEAKFQLWGKTEHPNVQIYIYMYVWKMPWSARKVQKVTGYKMRIRGAQLWSWLWPKLIPAAIPAADWWLNRFHCTDAQRPAGRTIEYIEYYFHNFLFHGAVHNQLALKFCPMNPVEDIGSDHGR